MDKQDKLSIKRERLYLRRERLRSEMCLRVLQTLRDFKSQEEPRLKVTKEDVIHVLSSIVARKTE